MHRSQHIVGDIVVHAAGGVSKQRRQCSSHTLSYPFVPEKHEEVSVIDKVACCKDRTGLQLQLVICGFIAAGFKVADTA